MRRLLMFLWGVFNLLTAYYLFYHHDLTHKPWYYYIPAVILAIYGFNKCDDASQKKK